MAEVRKLFDEEAIARRVEELARDLARALPADFLMVGVLKGCFVFMADLVRALDRLGRGPEVEFLRLSSYGLAKKSSGAVRLIGDLPPGLAGRSILLVDDIVDTGRSLAFAKKLIEDAGARRVWSCALLDKPGRREIPFRADFVAFVIEDVFVAGYGIDYAEKYRHLPYIGVVD